MAEGVDNSFSRPGGAALQAAGKVIDGRYLWPRTTGSKGLNIVEYRDLTGHGLVVFYIYEEDGAELTGGFAAGVRVAQVAEQIRIAQGLPVGAITFCIDHDYSGAALAACVDAIRGAVSVLGFNRVGIYGGYSHLLAMRGICGWYFQTYAWSNGRVLSFTNVYQYSNGHVINGAAVDYLRNLTANFGQVGSAAPTGGGAEPITPPVEDDMGLPISFVKDARTTTVYVCGPVGYAGIRNPYHWSLLTRAAVNKGADPMLQAELDIVYGYLKPIGALPQGTPAALSVTPEQVAQISSAVAAAVPRSFTIEGKAVTP